MCCRYKKKNSSFHWIFLIRLGNTCAKPLTLNGKQLLKSLEESMQVQLIL